MSVNEIPERFAFGRNEVKDCVCPAVAAGLNPVASQADGGIHGLLEAAENYDGIVREYGLSETGSEDMGYVTQDSAKQAWIDMMELAIENDLHHAHAAIEVAERLGWVEEGKYEA